IGNVYFKMNQIGKALAYYQRALRFSPRDSDIRKNIRLTEAKRVDKSEEFYFSKSVKNGIHYFSMNEWFGMFLLLFICVNSALFIVLYRRPLIFKNLLAAIVIVSILFIPFLSFRILSEFKIDRGIVVVKKAIVRSGPSTSLSTLFFIHEGTSFVIQQEANGWAHIKLDNGLKGWVVVSNIWEI
ncbi:MAG: hypothetical protein HRT90_08085, partial [Candidatus Margulisbacteria bacterium]|nr:hypothetical protein [Candidatus Margulisiibacteriota bacterium]